MLQKILKALIRENDVTVAQLSRSTKLARQTIDNWLSGQEPRSLAQVKKVADYFGVSVDYLCFGQEKKETKIQDYGEEINAGVFEVVLRRVKK